MSIYDSRKFVILGQTIDVSSMWGGSNQMPENVNYDLEADGGTLVRLWDYNPGIDACFLFPLIQGTDPLYLWGWFLEEHNLTVDTAVDYDWAAAKEAGRIRWLFTEAGPSQDDWTFVIELIYREVGGNDRFFLVGYDNGHTSAWQSIGTADTYCDFYVSQQALNLFYTGHDPESPITRDDEYAATMWLMVPQRKWIPDATAINEPGEDDVFLCMHGTYHQRNILDDGTKYNDFTNMMQTSNKLRSILHNTADPENPILIGFGGHSYYFPGIRINDIGTLPYKIYCMQSPYSSHTPTLMWWHDWHTLPMEAYSIETSGEDVESDTEIEGEDGTYIQDDTDQFSTNIPEDVNQQQEDPDQDSDSDGTDSDQGSGTRISSGGGASSTGMVHLYAPTKEQMSLLANQLWTDDFLTAIKRMFTSDPIQSIISLGYLPLDLAALQIRSVDTTHCVIGVYDTGVSMHYVNNPDTNTAPDYISVDCGSIEVVEKWGGAIDYDPYSACEVYLPFIGFVRVSMSDILSSKGSTEPGRISLRYNINLFTGDCVALLRGVGVPQTKTSKPVEHLIGQYCGNCMEQIPFTGLNYANYYKNVGASLGGMGTAAVAAATGNFLLAGAAYASSVMNTASCPPQIQRSGSFSGGSARLQHLQPFIRLIRPAQSLAQQAENPDSDESEDLDAQGYRNFEGRACNYYVSELGSKSGFTMIKSIKLNSIGATEDEMKEIDSLLKQGVFI